MTNMTVVVYECATCKQIRKVAFPNSEYAGAFAEAYITMKGWTIDDKEIAHCPACSLLPKGEDE